MTTSDENGHWACTRVVPRRPIPRALSILSAIRESGGIETLSEISRSTRLPKSTVHRLLAEMQGYGMVVRAGYHYRHGEAVCRLARPGSTQELQRLRRGILPSLIDIHWRTGYLVGLGVASGNLVDFVHLIYSSGYCTLAERIENDSQLAGSAAGRVLMAFDPGLAARFAVFAGYRGEDEDGGLPAWLSTELRDIRRQELSFNPRVPGTLIAAAVPVFNVTGTAVAALSVAAPRRVFNTREAQASLQATRMTAQRILRETVAADWRQRSPGAGRPVE
ncbi:IclR family transcriptional regulator [Amycolatopsis silviterrae]|uniref:IclR family transcriptional regulator n=1 Tax=Amycolatopsis silviterrae TaxID=1656914 RepID=A0ABW5H448_9PSEU